MFTEVRCLAQIHVASVLPKNQANCTLHSGKTSKHGHFYARYNIETNEMF